MKPILKVGDKVKTNFYSAEKEIVRTVIRVFEEKDCESGYRISADGGSKCPTCGRIPGTELSVDMGWFTKVEEEK